MKGQMSLVFTYIFVLIVAGLILFYGVRLVNKSREVGEEAFLVNFYKELKNRVESFYFLDVGSRDVVELKLPRKVKYVCFIDNSYNAEGLVDNLGNAVPEIDENLIKGIRDNQDIKIKSNVFISPADVYENNRFRVEHLDLLNEVNKQNKPEIPSECIRVNGGVLKLGLETWNDAINEVHVDVYQG